jgi:preprotein translocase subunit SecA
MIFHVQVEVAPEEDPHAAAQQFEPGASSSSTGGASRVSYSSGAAAGAAAIAGAYGAEVEAGQAAVGGNGDDPGFVAVEQRRVDEHDTLGRNDPCWCGSGKKYKKCHGA